MPLVLLFSILEFNDSTKTTGHTVSLLLTFARVSQAARYLRLYLAQLVQYGWES